MKRLIYILLILVAFKSFSQEMRTIYIDELEFEANIDTTLVIFKKDGKLLNGKYELAESPEKKEYSLTEFQDGKLVGTNKFYRNGILIGVTEYKNGMKNGYDIVYEETGKNKMWIIRFVNGKRHGLTWWADAGYEYYINGEKATQAEYEDYELKHK